SLRLVSCYFDRVALLSLVLLFQKSTLVPYTTLFRSANVFRPYPFADRRGYEGRVRPAQGHGIQRSADVWLQFPDSAGAHCRAAGDRKSTRLNSSHVSISYAVFCLKKKKTRVH